ncbi:MAG: hypothetical protein ACUVQ3_08555 [bacterium]
MFEKVLAESAIEVINQLSTELNDFYLASGTGLALQLGHRKSVRHIYTCGKKVLDENNGAIA